MASGGSGDLKGCFDKYVATSKDGRMDSKTVQKLTKDTGVIDGKYPAQLLDNDIARVLGKLTTGGTYQKGIKTFEFNGFKQLVDQIAQSKKVSVDQIVAQLSSSGGPSLSNVTGTANKGITDRMTDTSQYTGAHKERFDGSGQGKGKEGRVDEAKNSGYVGNYKGADTYDKTHK